MTGCGPESLLLSAHYATIAHRGEVADFGRLEFGPVDSLWAAAACGREDAAPKGAGFFGRLRRGVRAAGAAAPIACSPIPAQSGTAMTAATSLGALPSQRA